MIFKLHFLIVIEHSTFLEMELNKTGELLNGLINSLRNSHFNPQQLTPNN